MIAIFSWFFILSGYFCLWVISDYLVINPTFALLFLPFSFRLGLTLHTHIRYWWIHYSAEWLFFAFLGQLYPEINLFWLATLSLISIPLTWLFQKFHIGKQWKKLAVQSYLILSIGLLNSIIGIFTPLSFGTIFLLSITGGVLMLPACSLIYEYIFNKSWIPLTANYIQKPLKLSIQHIIIYVFLFILNIITQAILPEEFTRFAIFCLAIPIILLAYHYGWQGALLGTLLNSIALIATTHSFSDIAITDLLLSILMQTITGILLGLAVQYQRELNQHLSVELNRNKLLTKQLINTEEAIRKDISRELHDEIGQNITAIRTQSSILKRLDSSPNSQKCAEMIEYLSLNIYDTTKGLLNRIRPKLLDDLDLQQALQNLFLELNMEQQGIKTYLTWQNKRNQALDHILEITLYRLCQEGLNNCLKYANASEVKISIEINQDIKLTIMDNGIGFNTNEMFKGFGLRGMKERVAILDGKFKIISKIKQPNNNEHGTSIFITLPLM